MWDFSTEPEFEAQLDWMREFVADRGGAARPALADITTTRFRRRG